MERKRGDVFLRADFGDLGGYAVPVKGLSTLTEALERVGIETVPTRLERAYNAGETTQVPTGRVVGVRRRVRRKVGYSGVNLSFECAGPEPR